MAQQLVVDEEFEKKRAAAGERIRSRQSGLSFSPIDTSKMAREGIQQANPGGILLQPIQTTPRGEQYMRALDRIAPNVYAPTPQSLGQQPRDGDYRTMDLRNGLPTPIKNRQGPMSGIYREELTLPAQQKYYRGLNLRGQYNQAKARSPQRADALNEIWDRGGVPVIGGGTQRAQRQDFGGVNGVMDSMAKMRGIDTGIKAGAYTDADHAAALARHTGGDIYGGGDRRAHLARNRAVAGQGLLNTLGEKRALQNEAAKAQIDQMRNGGGLSLTPELAMKKYDVDQRTGVEREKIASEDRRTREQNEIAAAKEQAQQAMHGIRKAGDVFVGPDGKPLGDDEQRAWSARSLALESLNTPETLAKAKVWKKNPSAWTPVVDRQTGKIDFKETDPGWRNNWKDEKLADKTPRYVTLFEFDPIIAGVLYSQYGM